ncbi:hypothetical protein psyc5s11_07420 [Clostridium gelidum]|uniref:DUF5673 domain-containing protein n=1 Tax=Clostridium gelidum TaxID=704125 RepID=A0ABN6IUW1_9CLOT|nr:hypothetical protein [Clostridium gelidum]BCZ44675.1 hypothetical protein psyc5s11_07420 [Clostridium gelidum]
MKFNEKILGWVVIVLIWGIGALSYKFSWVIYILYPLFIITILFVLVSDIISLKKGYYCKEKKLSIKVSYYRYIENIIFILLLILNLNTTDVEKDRNIFILFIIFFIINLAIEYIKNYKIYFLENGIFIDSFVFNKKVIPYSKIEKLNFIEYQKGKFLLDIQLEKSFDTKDHEYKIKEKDKRDIISFINDFIDKEKIIETKEYKEDKLW